ncbi:MAG: aromatic-ring-hydroxylating dioxygenase subunit beta [Burkholderiales bacterium]
MTINVSRDTQIEVEQFLYQEASLLEDNQFGEWLDLLSPEVRYWMPVRSNRQPQSNSEADNSGEAGAGFSYYDDDKSSLTQRVRRIETGIAHAEAPLSVTQRLITNVRVLPGANGNELLAHSSFLVYQERRGRHGATFIGKRRDTLRRDGEALKIALRRIDLAQTILPGTISIFF